MEKYAYLILSIGITAYLLYKHKPKNTLVASLVSLWIFVSDVANTSEFIIKIPGAPFELQPLRTLLLVFLAYLIVQRLFEKYRRTKVPQEDIASVKPDYETYLGLYIIILLITDIVHFNLLGPAEFVIAVSATLSFYVVYIAVKKTSDSGTMRMIRDAVITVAVISSVVAIIQLLVSSSFLRVNPDFSRPAFGGLLRSTGVFRDDYMHAYAVIVGLIWAIFTMPNGAKKLMVVGVMLIGILFGFMRMGYVVTFVFFVHYFYFMYKGSTTLKALVVVCSIIITVLGFGWVMTSGIMESSVAQERMLDEGTAEIRGKLYWQAVQSSVKSVKSFFFGYGNVESPEYYDAMYKATNSQKWAAGERGGWHNLYLEVLFFHGIGAFIVFVTFLFQAIRYFYRLGTHENTVLLIPFYCVLTYMIANLSLALPVYSNFGMLVGITFALALNQRKDELNSRFSQPVKSSV